MKRNHSKDYLPDGKSMRTSAALTTENTLLVENTPSQKQTSPTEEETFVHNDPVAALNPDLAKINENVGTIAQSIHRLSGDLETWKQESINREELSNTYIHSLEAKIASLELTIQEQHRAKDNLYEDRLKEVRARKCYATREKRLLQAINDQLLKVQTVVKADFEIQHKSLLFLTKFCMQNAQLDKKDQFDSIAAEHQKLAELARTLQRIEMKLDNNQSGLAAESTTTMPISEQREPLAAVISNDTEVTVAKEPSQANDQPTTSILQQLLSSNSVDTPAANPVSMPPSGRPIATPGIPSLRSPNNSPTPLRPAPQAIGLPNIPLDSGRFQSYLFMQNINTMLSSGLFKQPISIPPAPTSIFPQLHQFQGLTKQQLEQFVLIGGNMPGAAMLQSSNPKQQ